MRFYRGLDNPEVEKELSSIVESVAKKDNNGRTFTDILIQIVEQIIQIK